MKSGPTLTDVFPDKEDRQAILAGLNKELEFGTENIAYETRLSNLIKRFEEK